MKKSKKLLPSMILLAFTFVGISAASAASECKVIVEYCSRLNDSFQNCFDQIKIPPGGEVSSIVGADIQINCSIIPVVCNAQIIKGEKISCFSTVPPSAIPSARFQLGATTPNDICRTFKIGTAQKTDIAYLWCPNS